MNLYFLFNFIYLSVNWIIFYYLFINFIRIILFVFLLIFYYLFLLFYNWVSGLMSRLFANDPGDRGSIPGRVIPKTQKMVLNIALLNTQHYKVEIKGKVEQSREWSSALPCSSYWKGSLRVTLN